MKRTILRFAVVGAAIIAGSSAFATNVVLDGNFNNSNGGFTTISSSFGPWTVTSGSIDLIGGYWQSPTGPNAASGGTNGSVDMDGNSVGAISQVISGLTSGKTYTLQFYLSGNPDGAPTTKSLDVSIGSVVDQNFTYTNSGNTYSNMKYTLESLTFTAGPSDTLTFASQDPSSPGYYGPVIGGVSIAIPEPSTWAMMLLGFAGLGYAGYRASRKNVAAAA
jgi:choice-of-anchor C domain-containing protein